MAWNAAQGRRGRRRSTPGYSPSDRGQHDRRQPLRRNPKRATPCRRRLRLLRQAAEQAPSHVADPAAPPLRTSEHAAPPPLRAYPPPATAGPPYRCRRHRPCPTSSARRRARRRNPGSRDLRWLPGSRMRRHLAPGCRSGPSWRSACPCCHRVLGILAAIAIPVFLNQRSTPVTPDDRPRPRSKHRSGADPDDAEPPSWIAPGQPGKQGRRGGLRRHEVGLRGHRVRTCGSTPPRSSARWATRLHRTRRSVRSSARRNAASHVSMCLRIGTRGSIEVMAIGGSDLSQLAIETSKVWDAQPYGN